LDLLRELSPHVVCITNGWSGGNVGGISLNNSSIAVDTTHNFEKGKEFRRSLESHFGLPVEYVFLTHHHSDHAKGLDAFHGATIISSKETAKKVRSLTSISTFPTEVFSTDYHVQDGDRKVEMFHSGGHTSDSAYLYFPEEAVIFAGDLIFENYLFFAGYKSNPNVWIDVLTHFRNLRPRKIVPGHGPVLEKASELDKHIDLLIQFRDSIRDAKESGIDPRTMTPPDFIFSVSERLPEDELVKWYRRTARSWYKFF
jgi:glyoxylase-like metal-dependent hydrolase (beta-lactamase superfamily II)